MTAPFNHIAPTYDTSFTQSAIGKLQRDSVWRYLQNILPMLPGKEVLELNCGTGEDAIRFARLGFNIVASDIASEMIMETRKKVDRENLTHVISPQLLDLTTLNEKTFTGKFDLVFSNFGGLNCIHPNDFQKTIKQVASVLKPGGRFVAVIMPEFCLWETVYFMAHLQFRKAFRRLNKNGVVANLAGATVRTWYYNPRRVKKCAQKYFDRLSTQPIGIVVPPSYLENFFLNRHGSLQKLGRLEQRLSSKSFFAGMADHYIIDLQLK